MTLIADASSMILLSKTGLLKIAADKSEIMVPRRVYEEVSAGKSKGRPDAFEMEMLARESKIKIVTALPKEKQRIEKLFGLFAGENEVLACASGTENTVLTDDKKCMNAARVLGLKFVTTLDVIVEMQGKKWIARQDALKALDSLENYGWYKHGLIDAYRRLIT